jgi:hypothetical protein
MNDCENQSSSSPAGQPNLDIVLSSHRDSDATVGGSDGAKALRFIGHYTMSKTIGRNYRGRVKLARRDDTGQKVNFMLISP